MPVIGGKTLHILGYDSATLYEKNQALAVPDDYGRVRDHHALKISGNHTAGKCTGAQKRGWKKRQAETDLDLLSRKLYGHDLRIPVLVLRGETYPDRGVSALKTALQRRTSVEIGNASKNLRLRHELTHGRPLAQLGAVLQQNCRSEKRKRG
ncbi:MAG: hypothetical protein Q4A13_04965, partial [Fretibacterium sp.]|nr:hypothetical protein [Fretibacterium sp.]